MAIYERRRDTQPEKGGHFSRAEVRRRRKWLDDMKKRFPDGPAKSEKEQ